MALLFLYAFISIFFSFLCSILEAVLLSVTPTFLQIKKQEGKAYATTLEELKADVDEPLIAILTLNTIAHTVGAILVGVQASAAYKELYGGSTQYIFGVALTEELMVGIVSAVMTFLILVVSEIIPKTIGANYWKKLASFTAKTLTIMVAILKYTGLLWVLRFFTHMVGSKKHGETVLSREDFSAMAEIAKEEGVFKDGESVVIKNLLRFNKVMAKDIMTPRAVMKIAPEKESIGQYQKENEIIPYSRIPLYGKTVDNITGFVLKDKILEEIIANNKEAPLSQFKREIMVTTRNTAIPKLFDDMISKREHIALVVDEYGSVSGLVSMEDIIETLLGLEIMDERDNVADLQQLARKNWEERAKKSGIIQVKPDNTSP